MLPASWLSEFRSWDKILKLELFQKLVYRPGLKARFCFAPARTAESRALPQGWMQ
jgi:hypothetical protein